MRKTMLTLAALLLVYVGSTQCLKGDCQNGPGLFKSPAGSVYYGDFKDGLPHGTGRLAKVSGEVYEGEFAFGLYEGTGTLYAADSTVYTGSFRQGARQGRGTLVYANGKKWEGLFRNNSPAGEAEANARNLPFFSCDLENGGLYFRYNEKANFVCRFSPEEGVVYLDSIAFDLRTGSIAYLKKEDSVLINGQPYLLQNGASYAYRSFFPKKKYPVEYPLLHYHTTDHIIVSDGEGVQNDDMIVRVYKIAIPSGAIQKLSEYKLVDRYKNRRYVVSADGQTLFSPKDGKFFTAGGKKQVTIAGYNQQEEGAINSYGTASGSFDWFSPGADTLYRFDARLVLRVYEVASAQLLRTDSFTNNRLLNGKDGRMGIAAFSPATRQYLMLYDPYASNPGDKFGTESYRKAAVLKLDDPDYLLPLMNPGYTADFYVAKADKAYAQFREMEAYRDRQLAKWEANHPTATKKPNPKLSSILGDEEVAAISNKTTTTNKKSSGGVCIWCGGSGKVTSKDVYNKGYNSSYSTSGNRYTVSTSSGSTTTGVCPACLGTGH